MLMLRSCVFKELKKSNTMQGAKWEISSLPGCSACLSQTSAVSELERPKCAKGCRPSLQSWLC